MNLPHRAENNITLATSGVRNNAPESERKEEYQRILRLRRLERLLKGRNDKSGNR